MKKGKINVTITELFMAQASRDERFYGTIVRSRDKDGNPVCYGKIKVLETEVHAEAPNQEELGKKLDELVTIIVRGKVKIAPFIKDGFYLN